MIYFSVKSHFNQTLYYVLLVTAVTVVVNMVLLMDLQ